MRRGRLLLIILLVVLLVPSARAICPQAFVWVRMVGRAVMIALIAIMDLASASSTALTLVSIE